MTTATGEAAPGDEHVSGVPARAERLIFWGALVVALAPFLVLAVHQITMDHAALIRDHALTELRVRDVGSHAVLLGLYSRDGWSHPGPALFYTLAIPYRIFGGPTGLFVGAAVVNAVAFAGTAVVSRLLGGLRVALLTILGLSVMVLALGLPFWADFWVCFVTVLPFALFCSLAWAMALGRVWALPLAALVGSWLVQAHVGYAPLTAPLVVAGAVWLFVRAGRTDDAPSRGRVLGMAALTIGLVVVVWVPTLWDQVSGSGNLGKVVDWFRTPPEQTASLTEGGRIVLGQLAFLPDWITGQRRPNGINGETTLRTVTRWPVLLVPFAVAAFLAWRRRSRPLVTYTAVTTILLVVGIVAVSRTVGVMYEYRLLWIWSLAVMVVVTIGWVGWDLLADRFPGSERRVLVPLALAGVVAVSVVGVVDALDQSEASFSVRVVDPVADQLAADLRTQGGEVVLRPASALSDWYLQGLLLALEKRGIDARALTNQGDLYGTHRLANEDPARTELLVVADGDLDGFRPEAGAAPAAYDGPVPFARRMDLGREAAAARRRIAARQAAGELGPTEYLEALRRVTAPEPVLAVFRESATPSP